MCCNFYCNPGHLSGYPYLDFRGFPISASYFLRQCRLSKPAFYNPDCPECDCALFGLLYHAAVFCPLSWQFIQEPQGSGKCSFLFWCKYYTFHYKNHYSLSGSCPESLYHIFLFRYGNPGNGNLFRPEFFRTSYNWFFSSMGFDFCCSLFPGKQVYYF